MKNYGIKRNNFKKNLAYAAKWHNAVLTLQSEIKTD